MPNAPTATDRLAQLEERTAKLRRIALTDAANLHVDDGTWLSAISTLCILDGLDPDALWSQDHQAALMGWLVEARRG